ncbi:hypothetical protein [Siccibacter turicensis]|uniref:hypothetical protein n=1 Tax=Siccibacter turicensis TaxID=357233 RepID=UPI002A6A40B5|nr:hypothetical protein [Siccibacter turicensis]MDY0972583.1 hypothetical protein [Siccibacter turicensis]
MNEKYIAYETLVANRDAATWAMYSAGASLVSAFLTLFAIGVAAFQLKSWKMQEELGELKNFRLAAFRFQRAIAMAPQSLCKRERLDDREFLALMKAYEAGDSLYETTLVMHQVETKNRCSEIYCEMTEIFESYTDGAFTRDEARDQILDIRIREPLLNPQK